MDDCVVRGLSFSYSGKEARSDWKNHPERFNTLMKALGDEPGMRASLSTLMLKDWDLDLEYAHEVLRKHGLENVKIKV